MYFFSIQNMFRDPRVFQILFQVSFLTLGVLWRDFTLRPQQMFLTLMISLATQWFWLRRLNGKGPIAAQRVGYLSPFITACGVCLLLRSDNLYAQPLAACLGVSAKFLLRYRGKHLFNPANFAVILGLLFFPGTWVSPAQWGQDFILFFWIFCLGTVVTMRTHRFDISLYFLISWFSLISFKIVYLGQIWRHLSHQLTHGALLIFAFFMISDPMTIPNHPLARKYYAFSVALFAFFWQFVFFRQNGFLWSLFSLSILVPVMDHLWPAEKKVWPSPTFISDPRFCE